MFCDPVPPVGTGTDWTNWGLRLDQEEVGERVDIVDFFGSFFYRSSGTKLRDEFGRHEVGIVDLELSIYQ